MTRPAARFAPVVRDLLDRGLVDGDAIHEHGLLARDTSRSHGVTIVEVGDDTGYVVKDFGEDHDGDLQGSVVRERSVYRLAADHGELQRLLPRAHLDPESPMLVLDFHREGFSIAQWLRRASLYDVSMAGLLGARLAEWHGASRGPGAGVIEPAHRWVFSLFADDRPRFLDTNQAVAEWSATFLRKGAAAELLAAAEGQWQADTVIHGDLRFENCLVATSHRPAPDDLVFVDWEQAGWGDGAWDVASVLQEYLSLGGVLSLAFPPDQRLTGVISAFIDAYREVASTDESFLGRVVAFTGAKLLHRAVQIVSWGRKSGNDSDRHGLLGVELLEDAVAGAAWLAGAAVPRRSPRVPLPDGVREDLAVAAELVEVTSGRSAVVDGSMVAATDSGVVGGPASLANTVADALYGAWYLGAGMSAPGRDGPVEPADLDPLAAFSAAHAEADRFDGGWLVDLASDSGRLRVSRDGVVHEVNRRDAASGSMRPVRPGDDVQVRRRVDWVDHEANTWWTRTSSWQVDVGQPVTRLYLDVVAGRVAEVVALVTARLDELGLPYSMKVQADPGNLWRCDAAVVYLPREAADEAREQIEALAADASPMLAGPTPRLALRLASGVAMADGTVSGRSFGQTRCLLVADGLVASALSGEDPVAAVTERLARAGLDPAAPHLDPRMTTGMAAR